MTSRAGLTNVTSRAGLTKKQRYADNPEDRQRRHAYLRAWRRRRAEDSEYVAKTLAYNRAWRLANKERLAEQQRRRWAADPDRKAKQRKANLKYSYGLTVENYDAMLARQDGACAICAKTPAHRLCVDHCHATNTVRRLLCRKCNTGLGLFDHDPQRLRAAAEYLEDFLPRKRKRK